MKEQKISGQGFKKAKFGWIPKDWEIEKLSVFSEVKRGAGSQYLTYVNSSSDGIRLIRISDFLNDEPKYVLHTKDIDRFILAKNDLLIAGTGATAGISFEVPDEYIGLAFSYNVPRIRVNGEVNKKFILYCLKSTWVLKQQHALFSGNAQPFLDTNAIGGFKIPLPPLPEQQKIARILTTWDKAIEKTEHLIAKKQERKKGLMQQLLTGKRRFLEFVKSDKMHDTKLGMIPEDWDIRKLKNIACIDKESLGNGISPDYKFTYISLSDIDNGKIISNKLPVLNYSNSPSRARRVVHIGDILLANVRPNLLGYYIFNKEVNNTIVSTGFSVITPKEKISGDFIYQYLYSSIFQRQLHGLIVGSNYPAINSYVVKSLKIPLPDYFEQQKIASVLSTADNEIEYLQNQLEKLKEQKKGLMQKLLTGEVRVRLN